MSRLREVAQIVVQSTSPGATTGRVMHGNLVAPCALGRSGRRHLKREGDGASPIGRWRLVQVLYRADRGRRPVTGLPVRRLKPDDGWCDAPDDRNYNRRVRLPYPARSESLWRDDRLYDIVVVLDHNRCPRRRNGGSAIFLHLATPGFRPTAGCVALRERVLRRLLREARPGAMLVV